VYPINVNLIFLFGVWRALSKLIELIDRYTEKFFHI